MPLVNRTFDQLIDFTRTSAATYVNSSGNIASTAQSRNLLLFTQEFDNASWAKNNVTVTANNTTAPDGTATADRITASAGAAVHNTQQSASIPAQGAVSFYAKAGTHNFVQILFGPDANIYANFNVSTGVIGTVGSSATASITSVGNGWYRCAIVCTPGSTGNFRLAMISSSTSAFNESWTAAGTETIFAWGAQGESGSAPTDYTRNVGGVYPPRFDYDPVTLAPRGLLIEEQRTNLLTYSAQFDNAAWSKSAATVTADAAVSPDGTSNADKLVENTANAIHWVTASATGSGTTTYTHSIYIKKAGRNRARVALRGTATNLAAAIFDVNGGTVAVTETGTAAIYNAGNGWYRCVVTSASTSDTALSVYIEPALDDNSFTYTGDGTSGIFLYGAQLEAGAFATSYIPTAASQVTRTADSALIQAPNFASWYNQPAGTIVVSTFIGDRPSLSLGIYTFDDGTTNNALPAFYGGTVLANSRVGGSNVFTSTSAALSATPGVLNIAFAYQNADYASSFNGAAPTTQTSGAVPSGLNRLQLGAYNGFQINGHLRSLRYYPTRLTNAQLQALSA